MSNPTLNSFRVLKPDEIIHTEEMAHTLASLSKPEKTAYMVKLSNWRVGNVRAYSISAGGLKGVS